MKYDRILIFAKKGNLLNYLNTDRVRRRHPKMTESGADYYAQEREITLVARIRCETNKEYLKDRCICDIKCPVNPLPVKGEFELPSLEALHVFLKANGWTLKQDIRAGWFK